MKSIQMVLQGRLDEFPDNNIYDHFLFLESAALD